jgi:metal-dependent amidase/aminoacylase/carboxypeptidase family protein
MIDVQAFGSGNGDSSETANSIANGYISDIAEHIDSLSGFLRHLSLKIHDNPEVRYKEFIAHEAITTFMREQDDQKWKVTPSAYGIATAFVAVFDSGRPGPVVSFNAEYGKLRIETTGLNLRS